MEKNVMNVTENELLTILMNVEKPTFVNIVSETKVRMNKTDNPYWDKVIKTTKGNYFIGGTYEDMVIEKMKQQGLDPNFISQECSVGDHVTKCVQFNEKYNRYYLQYFSFPNSVHSVELLYNNNPIDRELIRNFEVKKSESSRQPQDKKVQPQSFMISSIKEISLNGTKYVVEG